MIYVLYGQPGSGKTTLGKLLINYLDSSFIIDGDAFRKMFTNNDYGKKGREQNIRNANVVATYLSKENNDVVMCLVNHYKSLREELKTNNQKQTVEILLESDRDLRREYHVEDFEIGNPDHIINTDSLPDDTWSL